jgi:hypothetical protein
LLVNGKLLPFTDDVNTTATNILQRSNLRYIDSIWCTYNDASRLPLLLQPARVL